MKKGVFFTMDAVYAFYIALIFMSTAMVLIESMQNYSENSLALASLAKDVQEVKRYDPGYLPPTFITTGDLCDSRSLIGSALIFEYSDIEEDNWMSQSELIMLSSKVCINE